MIGVTTIACDCASTRLSLEFRACKPAVAAFLLVGPPMGTAKVRLERWVLAFAFALPA